MFACGIRNPGIWNPVNQPRPQGFSLKKWVGQEKGPFPDQFFKGKSPEDEVAGIQLKECGTLLRIGIQNPSST